MYRRGLFHILVLLLVVLVGSAVAQQLTGSQLVVNGSGPNVIGGTPNSAFQLYLTGPFSGTRALHVDTIITPGAGNSGFGLVINPTLMKASSGTHSTLAGILFAPGIGGGAAATTLAASAYMASFTAGAGTTSAATLYIDNAPSGATNNYSLWVAGGPVKLDSTLRVVGDAQFDGNIAAKYQDVAEWVPSAHALAAGTVAIIDGSAPNRVVASDKPYDTHVAGVVSTRPGLLLGEGGADKTKLAHSGRVKVKVDARFGAIAIGDLLVTSGTPGYAMRSKPLNVGGTEIHRPGTLIGKALEPLATGQGEILVLLTLQ